VRKTAPKLPANSALKPLFCLISCRHCVSTYARNDTRGQNAISKGDYNEWERAVTDALIEYCECTREDAEGVFADHEDAMIDAWSVDASVGEALEKISVIQGWN
jgi:hypothetical protein